MSIGFFAPGKDPSFYGQAERDKLAAEKAAAKRAAEWAKRPEAEAGHCQLLAEAWSGNYWLPYFNQHVAAEHCGKLISLAYPKPAKLSRDEIEARDQEAEIAEEKAATARAATVERHNPFAALAALKVR